MVNKSGYEKFKIFEANEPSIGLGAICKYLNEGKTPTIYGFHLHNKKYGEAPHYWKVKKKIGGHHDFKYERQLLTKLVEDGYLNYLK